MTGEEVRFVLLVAVLATIGLLDGWFCVRRLR